ncbi:thermonuclease family protein [Agrobacterium tumefaciens]|uniref:Thermonuclease family protein n=1 Tax=Agrobacterium tumefaciens TaxID=358 RepID=A0AAP9E315_AGRTU|nr:thermonuclease family protein [Agrobacterium tumefaciens]NSZ57769.1 thermonuclease family protein [Agrobacterium tumefaciens]QDY93888.1 thermonuclease family protein [Agrobacterium tumefaciens]UXS48960.1 thermonuclease family protein [Agrobacterium tumefaciens]UXS70264.1 thermonuclease family protein [Agrobacterium tumefaciens]UXS77927.1 thermonuclease family protein [Agrobacterium tumefaciens]
MNAAILFACVVAIAGPASAAEIAGRASVVDGDTIDIAGQRIRFDGIDAPESRQVCRTSSGEAYWCGRTSAYALDEFLAQSRPTFCIPKGKSYDRVVAVCRRADGADVNSWMVRNGHAVDWIKYSKGRYAEEQREAIVSRRGVWSGKFQMPCEVRGSRCR